MGFHFFEYTQRFDPSKIEKGLHIYKGVWYSSIVQFSDWLAKFFIKLFYVHIRYEVPLKSGMMYILFFYEVSFTH